ncbi:MAG: hypothetical protein KBG15_22220 [Kofleriaceae bacterium]|nr:hypothetical protein [Kofleriaceae bacterium]
MSEPSELLALPQSTWNRAAVKPPIHEWQSVPHSIAKQLVEARRGYGGCRPFGFFMVSAAAVSASILLAATSVVTGVHVLAVGMTGCALLCLGFARRGFREGAIEATRLRMALALLDSATASVNEDGAMLVISDGAGSSRVEISLFSGESRQLHQAALPAARIAPPTSRR